MSMVRWEPFRDLQRMRDEMNRFLEEGFGRETMSSNLAVDVYQGDNDITVKAAVPGMKPEDIRIEVLGNMLTISGERREEQQKKEENYVMREMRLGRFQRQVMLPTEVDAEKADAKFEDGMVTLTLPISEKAKPKQIRVGQGAGQQTLGQGTTQQSMGQGTTQQTMGQTSERQMGEQGTSGQYREPGTGQTPM